MSNNIIITNISNNNEIANEGHKILEENKFFNGLDTVMQNEEFRSFYNKYFKDSSDIKTAIMYMKLYETIEVEYHQRNGCNIQKELLAFIIRELVNNTTTRKMIIKSFENFNQHKHHNFLLDIFENNIKKIKDVNIEDVNKRIL
jgi:hypothetical protein